MMKYLLRYVLPLWMALLVTACDKAEEIRLVTPMNREHQLSSSGQVYITIRLSDWEVEGVEDLDSGHLLLANNGQPLALAGYGQAESEDGWVSLIRESDRYLIVDLKENLSQTPRRLAVNLHSNGHTEQVFVTQMRGSYRIVKQVFVENVALRKIYESDSECQTVTLPNLTADSLLMNYGAVFREVTQRTFFESSDKNAFQWTSEDTPIVYLPDIVEGDHVIGYSKECLYLPGNHKWRINSEEFLSRHNVKVPPYKTWRMGGRMEYYELAGTYHLTIENKYGGACFEVGGTWNATVPVTQTTIFY